jgi:hypothetical protein
MGSPDLQELATACAADSALCSVGIPLIYVQRLFNQLTHGVLFTAQLDMERLSFKDAI